MTFDLGVISVSYYSITVADICPVYGISSRCLWLSVIVTVAVRIDLYGFCSRCLWMSVIITAVVRIILYGN